MWLRGVWVVVDGEVTKYFGGFPSAYSLAEEYLDSYRYWYPELDSQIVWTSGYSDEDYGYHGESYQTLPYGEGRQIEW